MSVSSDDNRNVLVAVILLVLTLFSLIFDTYDHLTHFLPPFSDNKFMSLFQCRNNWQPMVQRQVCIYQLTRNKSRHFRGSTSHNELSRLDMDVDPENGSRDLIPRIWIRDPFGS